MERRLDRIRTMMVVSLNEVLGALAGLRLR